jgi:hypothetical protein
MALVSDSIPNLIGGISQQDPKLRLATQAEDQVNCDGTVVGGLGKRPPTSHVKQLVAYGGGFTAEVAKTAAVHTISRDLAERYQVIVYGTTLRVFDLLTGNEKTVTTPNGTGYLTAAGGAREAITMATVQDFTFVVNKEAVPAMQGPVSDARGVEALVFVRVANYQTIYSILIDDGFYKIVTTRFGYDATATGYDVGGGFVSDIGSLPVGTDTDPATISTDEMASHFFGMIVAHQPNAGDYTFAQGKSIVTVRRDDGDDFNISARDSRGDTQMTLVKETIQRLSDLPAIAPHGFQVEVVGDPSTDADNYFAQFEMTSPALVIGDGHWKEIAKPGIPVALDPATMPHTLVRNGDGTFTFDQATWGNRVAGDEDTAPDPKVVGRNVNDALLLRNRLGFLAGQYASLSRATELFEFFLASATALTDADPINEPASHTKAVTLRHALGFKKRFFLFADEAQFELQYGGTTLSNETVEIVPVWEYKAQPEAKPVGGGKSLFFPITRDDDAGFAGVMEAVIDESTTALSDANEVTAHVPAYVPSPVRKLAASPNENILLVLSDAAPQSLWAYRTHWVGDQKVLSAWSRWDYFNGDADSGILNVDFIDNRCVMLSYRADGVYLETFSVAPKQADAGWSHQFQLDRKATEAACAVSYDAPSDTTTITAPYPVSDKTRVVARFPDNHTKLPGTVAAVTLRNGTDIHVQGDWTEAKFYIGDTYQSRYRFSPQFIRKPAAGGGQEIIGTGRLQMLFWTFHFAETGEFDIEVTPFAQSPTYVQHVSGFTIGQAVVGDVPIVSGQVRTGIQGKNTDAVVEVVNESHLPFHLLSVDWEGNYVTHSRRLSARHRRGNGRMVAHRKGKRPLGD